MPVRKGKDGKLEYYNENKLFNPKYLDKAFDILTGKWKKQNEWPSIPKKKDPYKGYNYHDHEGSCSSSSSCSPEDCPTCTNKACPNSYDDFLDQEEFKL